MQINRKSFGTLKSDRYGRVTVMDEWLLRQVLLYIRLLDLCQIHRIRFLFIHYLVIIHCDDQ